MNRNTRTEKKQVHVYIYVLPGRINIPHFINGVCSSSTYSHQLGTRILVEPFLPGEDI